MTDLTSPPPIDRPLLTRDLARVAASVATVAEGRLPFPIRWALLKAGTDLSRVSSEISSQPLALDDDDWALILDAIAIEIGAIRGVRSPLEVTPALRAALERLRATVL